MKWWEVGEKGKIIYLLFTQVLTAKLINLRRQQAAISQSINTISALHYYFYN